MESQQPIDKKTMEQKAASTLKGKNTTNVKLEGYAFEDNIIGVTLHRSNGKEIFDLPLREMILRRQLESYGFSTFVTLRDVSSGTDDEPFKNHDGSFTYLFLSIGKHSFSTAAEAHSAVVMQCEKLFSVSVAPQNNHQFLMHPHNVLLSLEYYRLLLLPRIKILVAIMNLFRMIAIKQAPNLAL